jgi:hypothetical protein
MDGHYTDGDGFAGVPAEAKATVAKHATAADTVNAYHSLSQKLSSEFRLPETADKLSAEQRAELTDKIASYNLHGIPDTPDGYEFTHAEGVEVNAELAAQFKALAHEGKIPPEVAQKFVSFWDAAQAKVKAANAEAIKTKIAEGEKLLTEKAWVRGKNGDLAKIQTMLAFYVTDNPASEEGKALLKEFAADMDRTEQGNNPHLLLALKKIHGDLIAEGHTFQSAEQRAQATGGLTYNMPDAG